MSRQVQILRRNLWSGRLKTTNLGRNRSKWSLRILSVKLCGILKVTIFQRCCITSKRAVRWWFIVWAAATQLDLSLLPRASSRQLVSTPRSHTFLHALTCRCSSITCRNRQLWPSTRVVQSGSVPSVCIVAETTLSLVLMTARSYGLIQIWAQSRTRTLSIITKLFEMLAFQGSTPSWRVVPTTAPWTSSTPWSSPTSSKTPL